MATVGLIIDTIYQKQDVARSDVLATRVQIVQCTGVQGSGGTKDFG